MNRDKLSLYWSKYKAIFNTPKFEEHEYYKWLVLDQCYEKWDWTAEDKAAMFKNTFEVKGSKNLWLSGQFYPIKMIDQFFDIDPEDVTMHFDVLCPINKKSLPNSSKKAFIWVIKPCCKSVSLCCSGRFKNSST